MIFKDMTYKDMACEHIIIEGIKKFMTEVSYILSQASYLEINAVSNVLDRLSILSSKTSFRSYRSRVFEPQLSVELQLLARLHLHQLVFAISHKKKKKKTTVMM